jgi:hypothetical protein
MTEIIRPETHDFSFMAGGPFYALAGRLGLLDRKGKLRARRIAFWLWLPIAIATILRSVAGWHIDPFVLDISVHVRFLVALPLLVLSGTMVETQCRVIIDQLPGVADPAHLERILVRARRWRDHEWVEAGLAIAALLTSQASLWGVTGPAGLFNGVSSTGNTVIQFYYAGLALPMMQFLVARWLWRWLVWSYVLIAVSQMPLRTIATHPDRSSGLGFMSAAVTGFAVFELAMACVLAGAWATQLLEGRATVPSLVPTLLLFILISMVLACGPLMPFTKQLYQTQRRYLLYYSPFALEYSRRFHRKWIEQRPETDPDMLGTSDIQSFADLGNFYRVFQETRFCLINNRKLLELWLAAILPMLPLVATVVPIDRLFQQIGKAIMGGMWP